MKDTRQRLIIVLPDPYALKFSLVFGFDEQGGLEVHTMRIAVPKHRKLGAEVSCLKANA